MWPPLRSTQNATLVPKDLADPHVADLKGKKVAFAKGSSSHNFIVQALKKGGLTYKDIEPGLPRARRCGGGLRLQPGGCLDGVGPLLRPRPAPA